LHCFAFIVYIVYRLLGGQVLRHWTCKWIAFNSQPISILVPTQPTENCSHMCLC